MKRRSTTYVERLLVCGTLLGALSACASDAESPPDDPGTAGDGDMQGDGDVVGDGDGDGLGTDMPAYEGDSCIAAVPVSQVAELMPTVGVVEFSPRWSKITSAQIEFGKTTEYGMTAPVDLGEEDFRTLLLGMAPNTEYHYRITVWNKEESCSSKDISITTGGLRTGVATPNDVKTSAGTSPGFIITTSGNSALILNNEGEVVWGYAIDRGSSGGFANALGIFSAKLSWDGKYMYARDLGPFDAGSGGTIWRIELDGSEDMVLPLRGGHHHDFAVIPDGIAYIGKADAGECDQIYTADPDGANSSALVNLDEVFGNYEIKGSSRERCHVNAINYLHDKKMYTVSDREKDVIGFVSSKGKAIQAVGPSPTQLNFFKTIVAEGAGNVRTWRVQHGHQYYADNKLAIFSNGNLGGGSSRVVHYTIDGSRATVDWTYDGAGNSGTQGDVDYLPNGNFLITASMAGNMHEIDEKQKVISRYEFGSLGYTNHRLSLYGTPSE